MGRPASTIKFTDNEPPRIVLGTFAEVEAKLTEGGWVRLEDPWTGEFSVNTANVAYIEPAQDLDD